MRMHQFPLSTWKYMKYLSCEGKNNYAFWISHRFKHFFILALHEIIMRAEIKLRPWLEEFVLLHPQYFFFFILFTAEDIFYQVKAGIFCYYSHFCQLFSKILAGGKTDQNGGRYPILGA